jgi:hypothetical protein
MLYTNHRNNIYFSLNKSHLEYMRVVVVVVVVVVMVRCGDGGGGGGEGRTSLSKRTKNTEISVQGIKKIGLISSVLRFCST